MISVVQLGTVDYPTAVELQHALVELRKQQKISDLLLLLEHPPVITLGRNAGRENLLVTLESLREKNIELYECDRGGDITFHGPGQVVGYPIFDLRGELRNADGLAARLGPVEFVRRLEQVLIRTCAEFGLPAAPVPGATGVWTSAGATRAKIAAIGVHISRGVTSHGFALNVHTDLEYFKLIVPCGIREHPVTSLHQELARLSPAIEPPTMDEVREAIVRNFGKAFSSQVLWLDSLDDVFSPANQDTPLEFPAEFSEIRGEHKFSRG